MGAGLSNLENSYGTVTATPRVIAFHSKDQWKAHFDASKETNKLVRLQTTRSPFDAELIFSFPCQ